MSHLDPELVCTWAREGGALALSYFNRIHATHKADGSRVTQADLEIEALLRTRISAAYPDHGIIGEEQAALHPEAEYVWVIDPIDGTSSFIDGLAHWSVSIGLLHQGVPILGVVYLPVLDDCYWSTPSGAAFRNGEPLQAARQTRLSGNDWIAIGSYTHRRLNLDFPCKARAIGSVAADFCYVARGSAAAALIGRASLWDVAGGLAIARAAGAIIVAWDGTPLDLGQLWREGRLPSLMIVAAPHLVGEVRAAIHRREP